MERLDKEQARSAWRASQRKRGRTRGRGHSGAGSKLRPDELASNNFRYDEKQEDALEPGQYAHQSQGLDLAALLTESLQMDKDLAFRSRALLDIEAEQELPVSVLANTEEALSINFAALGDALAELPLHELLGVQESYFRGQEQQQASQQPPHQKAPRPALPAVDVAASSVALHRPHEALLLCSDQTKASAVHYQLGSGSDKVAERQPRQAACIGGDVLEELLTAAGHSNVQPVRTADASPPSEYVNAPLADRRPQRDRESGDGGSSHELDELLGMSNVESPSSDTLAAAASRYRSAAVVAAKPSKAAIPKQTGVRTTAISSKQDSTKNELEDWLNGL